MSRIIGPTYRRARTSYNAYMNTYPNYPSAPYPRRPRKGTSTKSKNRTLKKNYFKHHITAFPQHMTETIRYAFATTTQSLAASTYAEQPIILNGPYEPDAALTATQPAGFAKMMAVYTKCAVKAAKITITFQQANNGGVYGNLMVGCTITTNATSLGTFAGAVDPGLVSYAGLSGSPRTRVITMDCDIQKFLGVNNLKDAAGDYACTVSANPNQIVVAHIWLYNQYGATTLYNFAVVVDFVCDFYDPVPVT